MLQNRIVSLENRRWDLFVFQFELMQIQLSRETLEYLSSCRIVFVLFRFPIIYAILYDEWCAFQWDVASSRMCFRCVMECESCI